MSSSTATIPPAKALELHSVITLTEQGIASRVLAKTSGGNLTLFAFHAGHGLTKHTSPFDALVVVLEGTLTLTTGGTAVRATPSTIVRMPADVAHAVDAPEAARMCSSCCGTTRQGGVEAVPSIERSMAEQGRLVGHAIWRRFLLVTQSWLTPPLRAGEVCVKVSGTDGLALFG